ncbi:imidazole glycerol phosphate synthase subunit HisH [cyanobacterium TDX16]|nr:imidazole glycerol phosphate synthase subunit HisH [cyanobacterium TDX16]
MAVLDYGIGNLRSAQKGLERAGADARLTADHGLIAEAAGVVLPGVGAFGRCRQALDESGLTEVAREAAASPRPFLGICIGMQLLYEGSDEDPEVEGLGVLPGRVRLLPDGVRRPQIQWNVIRPVVESPLVDGLPDAAWVYFNHSFAAEDTGDTVAVCDYGGDVVAAVERGAVAATQFHPEKSSGVGQVLLGGWVRRAAALAAAA